MAICNVRLSMAKRSLKCFAMITIEISSTHLMGTLHVHDLIKKTSCNAEITRHMLRDTFTISIIRYVRMLNIHEQATLNFK
jgi:hypothetical protein